MTLRVGGWAAQRLLPVCLLWLAACAPATTPLNTLDSSTAIETARRQGQLFQALYLVEAQAAASGWTPALQRQAGDLWDAAGDPDRALVFWSALRADGVADVALARRLAQGYVDLQRWPEATQALDDLLTLDPDDAWAHLQLGMIRLAFDADTATTHLRAALTEPGYEATARALLSAGRERPDLPSGMAAGLMLAALEQWPYAELAFRHVADVAAPYPVALAYTALARDRQGKPAERWMADALRLAPDDALVRFLQGLHLRAIGDNVGSVEALGRAVALDPENPAYHAELSSAYRLIGELHLAEYWLQSAVRVSSDDARFVDLLAQFYADEAAHLTDDGVDALAEAASAADGDATLQAGFGWALYRAGRVDEALAAFDAALEAAPDDARALYYKGRVLVETGATDDGAEFLRRAAESDTPWAADAQALLDALVTAG